MEHMGGHAHPATPPAHSSMHAMHGMEHAHEMAEHPLGFGHAREASGTSWLPDETRVHHLMTQVGGWSVIGHGSAFLGYDRMNGPRGDDRIFAPNMVMVMADHFSGPRTRWRLAGMFSADAATVGGQGYPLLFQTGETWNDVPLHDHQHPHNVFSELSASVVHAVGSATALHLYVAPVGEPALGPPSYPHRPIADSDPLAPISHHWQDATHISFGVITAGLERRRFQVEGSVFNGREPGENRAEIQSPEFDSGSGRISFNPERSWALQVSHGYLHGPEAARPEEDVWRTTASVVWVHSLDGDRSADLALVWGRNRENRQDLDSWLLEGEWARERGVTPFARLEQVEKTSEDLVLPASFPPGDRFTLRQATIGATVALPVGGALSWAVGAQGMLSFAPDELGEIYAKDSGGWVAFLRVRPGSAAHGMSMH